MFSQIIHMDLVFSAILFLKTGISLSFLQPLLKDLSVKD